MSREGQMSYGPEQLVKSPNPVASPSTPLLHWLECAQAKLSTNHSSSSSVVVTIAFASAQCVTTNEQLFLRHFRRPSP